jgi:predicted O-methyltransferase YrrM
MELICFETSDLENALWKRMLGNLDKETIGVEIGCLYGDSAKVILGCSPYINLTSIDPFIPDSMEESLIGSEEISLEKNKEDIKAGRFKIIKDYSWNVVEKFEDNSLDFVFIDGDHRFDSVFKDYNDWVPKVKKNGLLFIHDARMYRPNNPTKYHVGPSLVASKIILTNPDLWKLEDEALSLICVRKIL